MWGNLRKYQRKGRRKNIKSEIEKKYANGNSTEFIAENTDFADFFSR